MDTHWKNVGWPSARLIRAGNNAIQKGGAAVGGETSTTMHAINRIPSDLTTILLNYVLAKAEMEVSTHSLSIVWPFALSNIAGGAVVALQRATFWKVGGSILIDSFPYTIFNNL